MYIGALDIGGTKTIVAITDHQGKIIEKEVFVTETSDCYMHLDQCLEVLGRIWESLGGEEQNLKGIGVTLPGIVDSEKGELILAPYEKWEHVPVASYLSQRFHQVKVFCENDVNACAIGEQTFGIGNTYQNYVWITVSTGVGGAVVNEGKLVKGAQGYAGELGHLKVEYENPNLCPCGQYGCLEAQGSGTALNKLIEKTLQEDPALAQAFSRQGVKQDASGCAQLAKAGNETAKEIFRQIGIYLGRGISYCVNVLNPQAVIIGGGVAASLDLLLPGIRESVEKNAFRPMGDFEIRETALGYEAALLGAAALVLQE